MLALTTLLLAQSIPWVYVDPAESREVVDIFKQACTQGELKISPKRARFLRESELTSFVNVLTRAATNKTVIEFTDPRATFLIFADYANNQPKSIGRECIVVSRVLSLNDALAALMQIAPTVEPKQTWIPNMYLNGWTIDEPHRGFRSSVALRKDRSVAIEVGTYANSLNNDLSAARKQ